MAWSRGRAAVGRYMKAVPELTRAQLRGAVREGAEVIAEEARRRVVSDEVRAAIKVTTKSEGDAIVARVVTKGKGAHIAPWLEHGTDPHFISVDGEGGEGRTAARINRLDREAAKEGRNGPGRTLVINGKPVGRTVHHPGARPHPFLRPAFDATIDEALTAVDTSMKRRSAKSGAAPDPGGDAA